MKYKVIVANESFSGKGREVGIWPRARLEENVGRGHGAMDGAGPWTTISQKQTEPLNRKQWKTRIELVNAMFEYFEIFHNRERRHSALWMLTAIEFGNLHTTRQPVA